MFFSRKALEGTRGMEVFKGLCCIFPCMLKNNLRTAWVFLDENFLAIVAGRMHSIRPAKTR